MSQIFQAHVGRAASLALHVVRTCTTAVLSENILILLAQCAAHILAATTMFIISGCVI